MAQDPPPATAEVRTPTVNLLVSGGEEPPAYLCPRFIGQPIAEVRRILEQNGFKVGQVTPVATNGGSRGIILTQSPPLRKQDWIGRGFQFPGYAVKAGKA